MLVEKLDVLGIFFDLDEYIDLFLYFLGNNLGFEMKERVLL